MNPPQNTMEFASPIPLTNPTTLKMDQETQNPNPNKHIHHIGGIPVEFPYKPYGSQLAFMSRVISTLDRAQKQGHCNALLESPTGTGKTLSLLCSALAWQRARKKSILYGNLSQSRPNSERPNPEAMSDPIGHGGGFVPEPEPSSNLPAENSTLDPSAKNRGNQSKKATRLPTIFYASRTHAQISQAIREYRKTSYRVQMAVLGSRKHYCTNKDVSRKDNIDEECKLLMKSMENDQGCFQFRNVNKVTGHPSLQIGGCNEAHDIEDLVKVGRAVRGCSYFAARTMAQEAQLVFCPYSYILNPTIRRAMEVDLNRSIVILDEAHNIEDMAREAASVDVEEDVLYTLQKELEHLSLADSLIYPPLHDMIEGILSWIRRRADTLVKREFQHFSSCWTGDKALGELQEAGISQQLFAIVRECAIQAVKAATDADTEIEHLSGASLIALEGLFSSLSYFFSGNGSHALDYQLVLRKYTKRDAGHTSGNWTICLSLWCMNPAVSFTEIADLSMSVILTSGTLSPMSSFSSELGVNFETCMEAPHVIDVESQVWTAVISAGPRNYPLNASYKTAEAYEFQDELGTSLEEICKTVPGGALVFFPSYNLMEKLCTRWRETGQWSRLNAQKSVFIEPRGHQDDFELTLKGYYDSIRRGGGPAAWKIKRGKKRGVKVVGTDENLQNSIKGGSAFLAVCRGKVSEGIDFSDENARVVVIVGIPFPNTHDLKVGQKKMFNDMYKSSKKLLSGNEWYCQQAFRALNQAAGRCIRHRFDYGAIIFMDERFKEERNIAYVSKWLRKSIKKYSSFDMSLEGLQSFFQEAKERSKQENINVIKVSDIEEEKIPFTTPKVLGKGLGKRKTQRSSRSANPSEEEVVSKITARRGAISSESGRNDNSTLHKFYSNDLMDLTIPQPDKKDILRFMGNCKEPIDLECSPSEDLRRPVIVPVAFSCDSPEEFVVKETPDMHDTPGMHENTTMANSAVVSNNDNSNSTVVQTCTDFSDQLSSHSSPLEKSSRTPVKPEIDSSYNLSVNSHTQKRRKPMNFSCTTNSEYDSYRNIDDKHPVECSRGSAFGDANRKIEFSSEIDPNEFQYANLNVPQKPPINSCGKSCFSSDLVMDKRLHLCCSLCTNSLGLPVNQFHVECSLTSSSKVYLASFLKSSPEHVSMNKSDSILVAISDKSSVDQRLYNSFTSGDSTKHDIWCEKDGCVFRTVFCPFCTISNRLLGLLIIAADADNIHLLNKILFYFDRLEIKNAEAFKDEALLPVGNPNIGQAVDGPNLEQISTSSEYHGPVAKLAPIENFSYLPSQQTSGGWRTTKSKLRLRKRGCLLSSTQD